MSLEIRCDDVLQTLASITHHQRDDLRGRSLFETFQNADRVLEEFNYPCTLAVLAEGIDSEPEWVDLIKRNKHRYKIELHGFIHKNYMKVPLEVFVDETRRAIDKIERTFDVKISTWYPPFGRKGQRNPEDSKLLGIEQFYQIHKVDAKFWFKNRGMPHVNFHYWHDGQVANVRQILCHLRDGN